ncbi:SHC-transforming protein 3, partial [Fasciolopsis buskii]
QSDLNSADSRQDSSTKAPPAPPPANNPTATTFDHFADFDENAWLLENDASNADALDTSTPANNNGKNGRGGSHPAFSTCSEISGNSLSTTTCNVSPSVHSTAVVATDTLSTPVARTGTTTNRTGSQPPFLLSTKTTPSIFERLEPVGEPWYVGKMSRTQAESLLRYEGDFLVRASPHQPGQFVLSGMQDSKCRHLLLADPNGLVRTKERVFDSIQHLIDYHVQNGVPIRSADSEIRLIFPVSTFTFCES